MSGDPWGLLLACNGQKAGGLLQVLHCIGRGSTAKDRLVQNATGAKTAIFCCDPITKKNPINKAAEGKECEISLRTHSNLKCDGGDADRHRTRNLRNPEKKKKAVTKLA